MRLDFSGGNFKEPNYVKAALMAQLDAVERRTGVVSDYATGPDRFAHLLEALHDHSGQPVAVLIDEYDKPILDALEVPDIARANRDFLRGLYAVIKASDAHVRFTFITGVSKFSKVSLSSGLNNLTDITLEPEYSALCGYTDADLDAVFAPELPGLNRDQIRDLFEFKVVELAAAGAAMAQLQERQYADKYRALEQPIYLIAVEFSKDERNLTAFDVEQA